MNGPPGMSVFQGNPSIQVANNSVDEEEEEQDRRRLHGEIQEALNNIIDDDTADESEQFDQPYGQDVVRGDWLGKYPNRTGNYDTLGRDGTSESAEVARLKRHLELSSQEAYHLKETLASEMRNRDVEIDKLTKCLAIANAEKERAMMTREQSNELLVESKTKCSELKSHVARLQAQVQDLQQQNSNMLVEIEDTNRQLRDAELQRQLAEGNALRRKEQLRESDRRNAETELLQQQVNGLQQRVEDRDMELKTLEKKYRDLERSREALLVDKSDTINDLMRSLGEAQEQCNELMSRPDLTHQNFQLRQQVAALERQAEEMQKRINGLTSQLDGTDTKMFDRDGNLPSSTPLPGDAKDFNIREQLYSALAGLKEKREDIKRLRDEVQMKNCEMEALRKANNDSLIKIDECEKEIMKLTQKVKVYESDTDDNRRLTEEEVSEMAQNVLKESQVEIEKLKNEYCSLSSAKNELVRELNELKAQDFVQQLEIVQDECQSLRRKLQEREKCAEEKDMAMEKQRWEHEKEVAKLKERFEKEKLESLTRRRSKNDSHDCSNCLNQMTDITRREIENIQLQKDCANYLREINHLKAELKESADTVNDLHARLGLKEEQNRVIADLREQAAKFGEYIKNCSANSTPQKVDSRDASVSTSPDMEGFGDPALYEQYSKAYSEEMKRVEMRYREKELRAEETVKQLTAYRDEMQKEFDEKLSLFKRMLLAERKQYEGLIEEKEFERNRSAEEHSRICDKYKRDLGVLRGQVEELQVIVRELRQQNEMEKVATMKLMGEWSEEKKAVRLREMEMQRLINEAVDKYESAKETTGNYKKYLEEKEAHMKREYDRIKQAYETCKVELDERLKALNIKYAKITDEKVARLQEEYTRKLEMLKKS